MNKGILMTVLWLSPLLAGLAEKGLETLGTLSWFLLCLSFGFLGYMITEALLTIMQGREIQDEKLIQTIREEAQKLRQLSEKIHKKVSTSG